MRRQNAELLWSQRHGQQPCSPVGKGEIVPPRTAPTFKALAADAMTVGRPMRPGADDYRAIPSVMAGRRVARSGSC